MCLEGGEGKYRNHWNIFVLLDFIENKNIYLLFSILSNSRSRSVLLTNHFPCTLDSAFCSGTHGIGTCTLQLVNHIFRSLRLVRPYTIIRSILDNVFPWLLSAQVNSYRHVRYLVKQHTIRYVVDFRLFLRLFLRFIFIYTFHRLPSARCLIARYVRISYSRSPNSRKNTQSVMFQFIKFLVNFLFQIDFVVWFQ